MKKSLIRHLLTALGTVLTLLGIEQFSGVINYIVEQLDAIYSAALTLIGVVTTIIGYFRR